MKTFVIRQGDVILKMVPAAKKPNGDPVAKGRLVLATGEVTGHAHVMEGAVAEFAVEGKRMIWVEAPATITHEDHDFERATGTVGILPVKPGLYELVHQWDEWTRRRMTD